MTSEGRQSVDTIINQLNNKIKEQPYEIPIRDEIYSIERLGQFAEFLANQLTIIPKQVKGKSLVPRLDQNEKNLIKVYKHFSSAVEEGKTLPPAGEWLIDNFHIVEDQIREVREDLPEKFYLELPKINDGELALYPRVYALALSFVAHTDSHINVEALTRFITDYQKVTPLTIGEIWAVAIALRTVLVENLLRVCQQVHFTHEIANYANSLADHILEDAEKSGTPSNLADVEKVKVILGQSEIADNTIILVLSKKLRNQHFNVLPYCECFDTHLAQSRRTFEDVLLSEHQFQASAQVTVSNIITSMRLISNINWEVFFESVNLIDPILAQDPTNAYSSMDFQSRDRYRHAIEKISKRTKVNEIKIAETALLLSQKQSMPPESHIGYYLFGEGIRKLESVFHYRQHPGEVLLRGITRHPTLFYFGILTLFVTLATLPLVLYLLYLETQLWEFTLALAAAFLPIIDSCLALVNILVSRLVPPRILPKLDVKKGIPAEAKTFVVVPTMFASTSFILDMVDFLETRYLSNPHDNLYFALLADFLDCQTKTHPDDSKLIQLAKEKIEELNRKFSFTEPKFFLFVRERKWNASENVWMGWERKRGKLHEFNRYLRGSKETSFIEAPTFSSLFLKIKYVITVDSDTHIPRGSAEKLIGAMLHPLNRPIYNEEKNKVIAGYGILQPRISMTTKSASRSLFSIVFSGNVGIDPYTTAVSDVYQDLFGEGIFTGKGIYDIDAYEASMAHRVPENTLLSHDLFESLYCRTALVTDIEFLDDYPSHYQSFAKRQHRWTRGDWQLLPFLKDKSLSIISRWKVIDNLRRSLVAFSVLVWLFLGWTILPGPAFVWTLSVLIFLAIPPFAHATNSFLFHTGDIPWTSHFWNIWGDAKKHLAQIGLLLSCLVHQAYLQLDAIARTLYRLYVSRRHLLQWISAAETEARLSKQSHYSWDIVVPSLVTSTLMFFAILAVKPSSLMIAWIFLIPWLIFPWFSRYISQAKVEKKYLADENEKNLLHILSRKTWNFYEEFVHAQDNWLIPDNFQEDPKPVIAHRTSPTNIGLLLLSTCSAYDLGYITLEEMIQRLEQTMNTLLKLEKWKGHLYNWYDTQNLTPLYPKYISTVDSGNLAGHLLAMKQTCLELSSKDTWSLNWRNGLRDTLLVLRDKVVQPDLQQGIDHVLQKKVKQILPEYNHIHEKILHQHVNKLDQQNVIGWSQKALQLITKALLFANSEQDVEFCQSLRRRLQSLANQAQQLFYAMDFTFLYDEQRKIFTIGYNATDGRLDNAYYDLLASEARLTSLVAIGRGQVPQTHWFHLGRQMTTLFQRRSLISWSASLFEYLMPLLVMRNYPESLLYETYQSIVHQQKAYADRINIPWGISESAYNARDLHMNYQYGPFGVPGLGLKRGLKDDQVISPYSTVLSLLVDAKLALLNLKKLVSQNLLTDFGFYEAVDYTTNRLPPNQKFSVIKNFMAHHQGMILVSLNNFINNNIMQDRFHNDEIIRSTEFLLQERIPRKVVMSHIRAEEIHANQFLSQREQPLRIINNIQTSQPVVQILSNGKYTVGLSSSGSGFSRFENIAITRWHQDPVRDCMGTFFYIRDYLSGFTWSATMQPMPQQASTCACIFSEHKAEFRHRNDLASTLTEVVVAAEDNAEVRRISLTNLTEHKRAFEITSYFEPVFTYGDTDLAHPAFSNLFIETEFIPRKNALLVHRRKRASTDPDYWGFHVVSLNPEHEDGQTQCETNRQAFIGRGEDVSHPEVMQKHFNLTHSEGFVLDPCISLRKKVIVESHATAQITFATGFAHSREEALGLIDRYQDAHVFSREEEMAWTRAQMDLRHLGIDAVEVEVFQNLSSALIFSNKLARANLEVTNTRPQAALWAFGISGDLPVMTVLLSRLRDKNLVRQLLRFQSYLRMKNIAFDIVFVAEEKTGYRQEIVEEINQQIRLAGFSNWINKSGGVFILRKSALQPEDFVLIQDVARLYLEADHFTLKELSQKIKNGQRPEKSIDLYKQQNKKNWKNFRFRIPELSFFNGHGGFSTDGREYIIHLTQEKTTPLPWINVIANEKNFGFLVSETGSSFTWSANSRENRLTPWNNDPVSDPSGEMFYIKDLDSHEFWSPTRNLDKDPADYLVRHGHGYSLFEHFSHEIEHQTLMFVARDEEIKIIKLSLHNKSETTRRLSVYFYLEWVLGLHHSKTAHMTTTLLDKNSQVFMAKNAWSNEFSQRIAFAATSEKISSFTCDRKAFLGRHGNYKRPSGLKGHLSGEIGNGFDPCLALQIDIVLKTNETRELVFLIGQNDNADKISALAKKYSNLEEVTREFEKVKKFWDDNLSTITVKTPYPELNALVNRWLLYQTLVCRFWARSGFYQSGGAFGFRDQLQDAMALIYIDPQLARAHICEAAQHQFAQGDVLHWWHPPYGKGVRTRFSDDLLWLPYVVCFYILTTKDSAILHEMIPFIEGENIPEGHEDIYLHPKVSTEKASLYEHCARAIDRSLKVGTHGLPLMGCGDWNDGMNRIGHLGKGESVWMGWFLAKVIKDFLPLCEQFNDSERQRKYTEHVTYLKNALEEQAWDGQWYRRAFFDDGTPVGSEKSEECKIDSLVQSWAVLSGLGNKERSRQAMASVNQWLIDRENKIVKLFTPPFDHTPLDPGYIKGYLPGVRENGGQYTHAAIWVAMAFADANEGDKALEILNLINPINHTNDQAGLLRYKIEPYVIAADVYAISPHVGRGGWSWYTGSSGWYYRAVIENILGIQLRGDVINFKPCLAKSLSHFEVLLRYKSSSYEINFENKSHSENPFLQMQLDGKIQEDSILELRDDGHKHIVKLSFIDAHEVTFYEPNTTLK